MKISPKLLNKLLTAEDRAAQQGQPNPEKEAGNKHHIGLESDSECAAALSAGEFLYEGLAIEDWNLRNPDVEEYIQTVCLYTIQHTKGKWGHRPWSIDTPHKGHFYFDLYNGPGFDKVCHFNPKFTIAKNRKTVKLTIPSLNPARDLTAPEGATHFAIGQVWMEMPDYLYNPETQWHDVPAHLTDFMIYVGHTEPLPLHDFQFPDYEETMPIERPRLDPHIHHVAAIYILFFQFNGIDYEMASTGNVGRVTSIR